MRPETAIVEIHQHRIYTEFHANKDARQTIILVNGSLSTTASFAQTVKYLQPHFNVVCYDQPYAGGSKAYNQPGEFITKEYEAQLLLGLIEHFRADVVMSFSWGGVATLLALAQRPSRIRKAVIASFSPLLNAAMLDYLHRGLDFLGSCDRANVANLVNDTIGRYLPHLFKRYNFRHVASLDDHEYLQMHYHVCQVLKLSAENYMDGFSAIDIPLLFVNGELDHYTAPADARLFQQLINDCRFHTIRNAGHFIDVEHKQGWHDTRDALLGFLRPQRQPSLSLADSYLPSHQGMPIAALAG
ncbi:alpha/beta fold hydrolase [Pseudomonas panipatensis]|uniref:Pimeloyl-ACP methyl ester carboxylesterase n=1 Tax=Pseudomonas panipatensis TaxID=428992 RepID=A0A1G8BJ41_9PSED|nr:alpha/beta fold hydrolase [Pseudomonas panipatensis]SDH33189.1 Pimeloyl-ACP methyl ester carboxylesterase [Pseudomonas panipatensis]SMP71202.1 Pimeloyl-ACP methyl ester carboxylesterase [Pseudomonas panipatensis]